MKKEALEVLKNRRAIRSFKPEQITAAELEAVLEVGIYAPSGLGAQSPVIIAVQDADTVAKLSALNAKYMGKDIDPYYGAPTILLVMYGEKAPNEFIGTLDCAAACTNMLNAAYAAGLGSCWVNRCKEMFEDEEGKALLEKWGITEQLHGIASIALGYPAGEHPQPKPRKEGYVVRV